VKNYLIPSRQSNQYIGIYITVELNFHPTVFANSKFEPCSCFFASQVLVMTPQILLHNLSHCFIKMEMIALLIFDECHHAQVKSSHPYAEIMKVCFTFVKYIHNGECYTFL